jgi:hypothetical protein
MTRAISKGTAKITELPNSKMLEIDIQLSIEPDSEDEFITKLNELIHMFQK